MDLKEIGEFGLIQKLRSQVRHHSKGIKVGIGDDCAVIAGSKEDLLVTSDILIENIHFDLNYFTPKMIGKKAVAVNLSDIAAMGGIPKNIFISLGLPSATPVSFINKLYDGFEEMAEKHNCTITGGDTSRSFYREFIISITVIGEAKKNRSIKRSGAKAKDKIFVTGTLGDSSAGLEILKKNKLKKNGLTEKHLSPEPRLNQGRILAEEVGASSMIDLSDGLASDLKRICEESKCGANIYLDHIPLSPGLRKSVKLMRHDIFHYALFGGEDYELLFTVEEKKIPRLLSRLQKIKTSITCIGEISSKNRGIKLIHPDGKKGPLEKSGYDHFK